VARYGLLADIHANREALSAALGALAGARVDGYLCLGDIVGYNADADECVALLRERGAIAVAGNHDLIGIGRLGFERCADKVAYSLERTRRALRPATVEFLAALQPRRAVGGGGIVMIHGGVRQVDQYIAAAPLIKENAAWLREDFPDAHLCLFGHTHHPKVYEVEGAEVCEVPAEGTVALREDRLYFVNPGSVDGSRKRDVSKRAECAVLDTAELTVEFLSAEYDHTTAESRAQDGGYRMGPWTDFFYGWRRRLLA